MQTPTFRTHEIRGAEPYPSLGLLTDDLKRGYRLAHPHQPPDEVEFRVYPGPLVGEAVFEASSELQDGDWTIFRHVLLDIKDNRVVRRREIELPMMAYWVP